MQSADLLFSRHQETLAQNSFASDILKLNHLQESGILKWLFYPGMLFDSEHKWWGDWKYRSSKHEGLDLAFYLDLNLSLRKIWPGFMVPALYPGQVKLIIKDFLGQSVFLEHDPFSSKDYSFCSLYAHLKPDQGLEPGLHIKSGQCLGEVLNTGARINLAPHIHLSLGWFKGDILPGISWPVINSRKDMLFIDPLKALNMEYALLNENTNMAEQTNYSSGGRDGSH